MFDWLSDNLGFVYLLLGVVALGWIFVVWMVRQNAKNVKPNTPMYLGIGGLSSLAVLTAGVTLVGLVIQTDQQRVETVIREMTAAIRSGETDRVFLHVSDDFNYHGMNKIEARQALAMHRQNGNVTDVEVWDFEAIERIAAKNVKEMATIQFKVKPKGNWEAGTGFRCKATIGRDADGKWRLQTFELFDLAQNQPIKVPFGPGL